jgi:5-methyltetrahydropteroyltriglutamate--homocysteine methyltransferase
VSQAGFAPVAPASGGERELARPAPAPPVPALAVMGIGSWPRPRWLLEALHARLEGRLDDATFQATADDAVRLVVAAQQRAGASVLTDGEQRRDSYANFVGMRLDDCQSIPLVDLLALVDDPEKLEREFAALDVPAASVRHPALFGKLRRTRPLVRHEADFLLPLADRPIKVAMPGPYLLSRLLWLECVSDRAYESREALAVDIVTLLREELFDLLAAGVSLVQLDEPVLSEVVFGAPTRRRSFMCGALSERRETPEELAFARDLINAVVAGAPRDRVVLHMCRGNWTPDESAALSGGYDPLVDTLSSLNVGGRLLEACTPRAGELEVLRRLPADRKLGLGVVNPKDPAVESVAQIEARMRDAVNLFGRDRVLFHPDCGFATFADNPVASAAVAEAKLANMVAAVARLG